MRFFIPFIVLFLVAFSIQAQPFKSALSGPILINEDSLAAITSGMEEMTFLPLQTLISEESGQFFSTAKTKPGIAFLSSAIIPGSGQAMNGNWGRAVAYFLTEALSLSYYINQNNQARDNERAYERYGDQNWSVLAYAQWLVDYSAANGLDNGYEQLQNELAGLSASDRNPNFANTRDDWRKVNLNTVRIVEVQTRFVHDTPQSCATIASNICSEFSHVVQNYGSQQYYELMSKYYQFQPGWEDFHNQRITEGNAHQYQYSWSREMITPNFIEGRDRAAEFNNNYRRAGNILNLLVVNHLVSAFDAFFTVKLRNSRLETQANLIGDESVSLIWHF